MQRVSFRRFGNFLQWEYERAFRHDHWHVGIVDAPIQAFLNPDTRPQVRWLPLPRRGKYLADPFGVARGDRVDILLEEYDFRSDRGTIAWSRINEDGSASQPRPVLQFPHHTSYPFIFEHGGSVFCIPETWQAREVSLYRAKEFPTGWERVKTLLRDYAGIDNTVVQRDGTFWMFNTSMDDGPYSKLRVWYAPELLGPWKPIAGNPVKTDIGSARPAGTPFTSGGELYRPSQDSSKTYGGSVVLNRVVDLRPAGYKEEPVAVVRPFSDGRHRHGIHTLSAVGSRTLVDGKRIAFSAWEMKRNFSRRKVAPGRTTPWTENAAGPVTEPTRAWTGGRSSVRGATSPAGIRVRRAPMRSGDR